MRRGLVLLAFAGLSANAAAEESVTKQMSFEDCLKTIRSVASDFGVTPMNIVETDILRIVRFNTADGSVLVSCSRPDNKMVLTKSN